MTMELLNAVDAPYMCDDRPEFAAGDTVKVHLRVTEGNKQRIQVFEGVIEENDLKSMIGSVLLKGAMLYLEIQRIAKCLIQLFLQYPAGVFVYINSIEARNIVFKHPKHRNLK